MKSIIVALCLAGISMSSFASPLNSLSENSVTNGMRYEAKKYKCTIVKDSEKQVRGKIDGLGDVVVASLVLEGCGGGNSWGSNVAVFSSAGRTKPQVFNAVEKIEIVDGKIVIDSIEMGEDDPRCCPSKKERHMYKVVNNEMKEVSKK
jgi:hypothetical protein